MWLILLFMLGAAGVVFWWVVRPLRWGWWWKGAAGVVLVGVALRPGWLSLAGGVSSMAPVVPPWVLHVSAALYVAFLLLFCGVCGGLVLRCWVLCRVPAWRRLGVVRQLGVFHWVHAGLLLVGLVLGAVGVHAALELPRVRVVQLPFAVREPLRVVLVSDLHVSATRSPEFTRGVVQRVNELQPDLVVLVGDLVDGAPECCAEVLAPLRELRARLGVFGVPGNHDYYSDYARWRPLLRGWGVRMLENEHVLLPQGVVLAGVTDESALFRKLEGPDLGKALRGAPPELPVLLLAHRPIVARDAAPRGVSLQLSGHLHGGLVWGLGLAVAVLDAGFLEGEYEVGNMRLFVSAGAGSSARTPFRLGVPTEVTLLTLVPEGPPCPAR